MNDYKPPRPRIDEEYGGASAYLDATKDEHNGIDAGLIKKYWNWGKQPHISISSLATMAGVVWSTMDDWIERLHKEAGVDRPRPRSTSKQK